VNSDEVVVHIMQGDGRYVVLDLLREGVTSAQEPSQVESRTKSPIKSMGWEEEWDDCFRREAQSGEQDSHAYE
jgi:hypothetical protein